MTMPTIRGRLSLHRKSIVPDVDIRVVKGYLYYVILFYVEKVFWSLSWKGPAQHLYVLIAMVYMIPNHWWIFFYCVH